MIRLLKVVICMTCVGVLCSQGRVAAQVEQPARSNASEVRNEINIRNSQQDYLRSTSVNTRNDYDPMFGGRDGFALPAVTLPRRKLTTEQKQRIAPAPELRAMHTTFLKQDKTGLIRLLPDVGCGDAKTVSASEMCRDAPPYLSAAARSILFAAGRMRMASGRTLSWKTTN